jgi:hypothetical protein
VTGICKFVFAIWTLYRLIQKIFEIKHVYLLSTQQKESGAWLNCLPSSFLGTLLDDSSFRIAVALRTGQPVCEPHTWICGKPADKFGHHGLSCRKSTGRHSRHGNINDIIKRALVSAEIPSILEPTRCWRSDVLVFWSILALLISKLALRSFTD